MIKRLPGAIEGLKMIVDTTATLTDFGIPGSFAYDIRFLSVETFQTFGTEVFRSFLLSLAAVLLIIFAITASLTTTALVGLCVFLTNLFLCGLVYFWNLTLNPITVVNIIAAIGTSVDYSAHIAYAYQIEVIPKNKRRKYDTVLKIRSYKVKQALIKMGASVFHGGFSTFLAICVLAPSTTYVFQVFFRLWFGIVLFGMMNGFLFLSVILSFIGPTEAVAVDYESESNKDSDRPLSKFTDLDS